MWCGSWSTIRARTASLAAVAFLIGGCIVHPALPQLSPARTTAAARLIDVHSLVPDLQVDMRYAGNDNFIGTPIVGYEAPRCYLLRPAAEALARVELALREQGFRLKVFDCYRPVRAVRHFVAWAGDLNNQRTKTQYYPNLPKQALLGDYIAPVSGHSRGATLDLTLTSCDASGQRCTPLDMGTEFDFLDPLANTDAPSITPAQRTNRLRLRAAMERGGFRNYPLEWWHYTLTPEPSPNLMYDVPVF